MDESEKQRILSKPRAEWDFQEARMLERELLATLPERVLILDGTAFHDELCKHYAVGWGAFDILIDIEDSEGNVVVQKRPLLLSLSMAEKASAFWVHTEMQWNVVADIWEKKPDICQCPPLNGIYKRR